MFGQRICIALISALVAAPVIAGQAKKPVHSDWPSSHRVARAAEQAKYQTDHTITAKYLGHEMKFIPADVSDITEVHERGFIIGKLTTTWTSADQLPEGTYHVFVHKANGEWQAFFCLDHEPIAKSREVNSGMDSELKPSFEKDNTAIRYWKLRMAY